MYASKLIFLLVKLFNMPRFIARNTEHVKLHVRAYWKSHYHPQFFSFRPSSKNIQIMQKIYSKLLLFKFSIPCIFFQFSSLQNIKKYTCAYYCLNLLLFESFLSCSILSLIYANRAERLFYFLLINASMHQTSKIKVGFSSSAMPPLNYS